MTIPNFAPVPEFVKITLRAWGGGGPSKPLPYGVVIERRADGFDYVLPRTGPDKPKRRTRD